MGASCHIITTSIEHNAVLNSCRTLESEGFTVTYLPCDKYGFIHPETLQAAIRDDTILISVMAANNEVGSIQPLKAIGQIARRHQIVFHTDAVQAYGHIPINVNECMIDMLSMSAHKLHGPKGVGFCISGTVLNCHLTLMVVHRKWASRRNLKRPGNRRSWQSM